MYQNKKRKEKGMKTCISLKELYDNGVQNLKYGGYIACTDDGGLCHYDLYKDDDIYREDVGFILCDGEEVVVMNCQNNEDFIVCESEYGKRIILSKEEYDIAVFKEPEELNLNWFEVIAERLRDYSEGDIWSTEDEILVRTEDAANAIVDMLKTLYMTQGEDVVLCTGYYDPEEDKRNNETDRYTGWWYVNIG